MALLQIQLESVWEKLPPEVKEQHREEYDAAIVNADELTQAVRNVSHRLHPRVLDDLGLEIALQQLSEEFEDRYLVSTRFSVRNVPSAVRPDVSVALYRIAQEALQNVAKHSGAKRVNIALVGTNRTLELSIRDNGGGFDPQKISGIRGLGLTSIVERTTALGGKISIEAKPGDGVRVHVSVPITAA
jgi:signal transduction histidine kinase